MTTRVYISFASDNAFLGACVVEVEASEDQDFLCFAALETATRMGINPGGEAMFVTNITNWGGELNRLYDRAGIEAVQGAALSLGEMKEQGVDLETYIKYGSLEDAQRALYVDQASRQLMCGLCDFITGGSPEKAGTDIAKHFIANHKSHLLQFRAEIQEILADMLVEIIKRNG